MPPLRCGRGRGTAAGAVLLALLAVPGCEREPITHPLRGKVTFTDGDIKKLARSRVEFVKEGDGALRAAGEISPDGSFEVYTQYKGRALKGVPEGTYRARIRLPEAPDVSEDDIKEGKFPPVSKTIVNYRFLTYERSGLKFTVPGSSDIDVKVSRR